MFVNATAGTTVFGAYDPIDKIAEVCKRHNAWLHIDSCWGGAVLLSNKLRYCLVFACVGVILPWTKVIV